MADNDSNMEVLTLAFADARVPEFKKVYGKKWVPSGEKEDFPGYIQMLYDKSAKHAAIIGNKVTYIMGNGFELNAAPWQGKANPEQTWNELSPTLCLDIENQGGFYLEVKPRLMGGYNYYHLSFERVRTNENNTRFWYKKDFEKPFVEYDNPTTEYPCFKPGIKVDSIYYYKEPSTKKRPYSIPGWFACANWIEADAEVSKWTLTNAKTGFSASKMLSFFNGEPKEGGKKSIERRIENIATGAEGKKILITYNTDPTKAPKVDDLGSSDLTKEDYTAVDNLITSNIFAGHKVTHPLLFGIQQEGKLGSATELRTAYQIFKNTYANAKQRSLEAIVKKLAAHNGEQVEGLKIRDLEGLSADFTEAAILQVAPRSWILEQLGIDPAKYTDAPINGAAPAATQGMVNEVLTNLTGKQHQQISRIVRQFGQGKINKEQAALMLKSGFGFTDEDVNAYLGLSETLEFSKDYDETDVALMFSEVGEERDGYTVVASDSYKDDDTAMQFLFASALALNELERQVLAIIKKDSAATSLAIAQELGRTVEVVDAAIAKLTADKVLEDDGKGGRKIQPNAGDAGGSGTAAPAKAVIRYSYEKRPEATGPVLLPTSRPFCKKMIGLNRLYTREDIQKISERLGYSVFNRAGGFWNNNGTIEHKCRHEWRQNVVIKKQ